jgi:hypothetical protein
MRCYTSPTLKYFKEKRDENIHKEPVNVQKEIAIDIRDFLENVGGSLDDSIPLLLGLTGSSLTPVKVTDKYKFDDWKGSEGVLELCDKYLHKLRALVSDGQGKGMLTS